MAYTSSGGLKTSTTVKAANIAHDDNVDIVIQNHAATVLKLKWGEGASNTDFDVILKACSVAQDGTSIAISLQGFPDDQVISCYSSATPSYTFSYR